jgi:A/G-specific adenine glycosylase
LEKEPSKDWQASNDPDAKRQPAVPLTPREVRKFRKAIYSYYSEHGRELPWRRTQDPYRILVSEIMLQQTQVERVVEKYPVFVRRFSNFRALADAPLHDVLAAWQGLGYNRRAASLKKIGEIVAEHHEGRLRADADFLTGLPGIGYNTACAILAFAFNKPVVFIETNIRTVFIHFFFSDRDDIRDSEILALVEQTLDGENPCAWYSALMDYGTMLKRTHGSTNPKSAHYQKQSPFKGSDRQVRGMVLKVIIDHHHLTDAEIVERLELPFERARKALDALQKEGFVRELEGRYSIA